MLKEKELTKIRQVRFRDGSSLSMDSLQSLLQNGTEKYEIPAEFGMDRLKCGGLIGGTTVDCVTLCHPQYRGKYNFFILSITRQGTYAFVDIYSSNTSKQELAIAAKKQVSSGNYSSMSAYNQGVVIGSLIASTVNGSLFKGKNKYEEEQNWYTMVMDVFDDLFE